MAIFLPSRNRNLQKWKNGKDKLIDKKTLIPDAKVEAEIAFVRTLLPLGLSNSEIIKRYYKETGVKLTNQYLTEIIRRTRMLIRQESRIEHDERVKMADELYKWQISECVMGWEKSKDGLRKRIEKNATSTGVADEMNFTLEENTQETDGSYGDLEYMKEIRNLNQGIIRLHGLEAPKKVEKDEPKNTTPNITINLVGEKRTVVVEDVESEDIIEIEE